MNSAGQKRNLAIIGTSMTIVGTGGAGATLYGGGLGTLESLMVGGTVLKGTGDSIMGVADIINPGSVPAGNMVESVLTPMVGSDAASAANNIANVVLDFDYKNPISYGPAIESAVSITLKVAGD